jgi:energy-coupling factor transport system ATP-binding protein
MPTAASQEAIRVERLAFVYPDGTRALDGVGLSIARGERVAIVGQNGSGKSTLVRHCNGLLRATEGGVWIGGQPVGRRHVAELARDVGLAFQDPDRQIFAGNVRDEVAFGPRNLGMRGDELETAVTQALEAVGLADVPEVNPYDLGFSRRKLLAIASILAMRTPIVILDEPTTGQDARGVARIQELVDSLASAGRTVVAISHDMRFVAESFARAVVMATGRIVFDGAVADAFAESAWPILRSTHLEPPLAAIAGARARLGSTPTTEAFVEALVRR